ncbi:MAG: DEAD/DEAH box helicase [Paludibacteraceae bacterium]|nr:DEAD/DEAH box helicase [Paludibacteraceae bacterium]
MTDEQKNMLRSGFERAFIDGSLAADVAYTPAFISNNRNEGRKVLPYIQDELLKCDSYRISVAFITDSGVSKLLMILKELDDKGVRGEILTTDYLCFSEPKALEKLHTLKNVKIKMYDTEAADKGFHTKGYIFKKDEIYRIIIGSSNLTGGALTANKEWNTRLISTGNGEIGDSVVKEFEDLWNSKYAIDYDYFIDYYKVRYNAVRKQREIAKQQTPVSLTQYKLMPNSMQERFIVELKKTLAKGENRALLISATGTGKTYASAFAMRELGYKRVLFIAHRMALIKQAKQSYKNVFGDSITMGIVGGGCYEYDANYVFAMVETINKEANLGQFHKDEFDCIILDEAHHSPANTYQRVMEYFTPKLFLGMTATPDRRETKDEEKNVYELFDHQIAYEIRLQKAMEENLLCPFNYYGISDIVILDEKQQKKEKLPEESFNLLTSDKRVDYILEQANYYGYSGDRVKGLIFCSRNKECEVLSKMFNERGYRTIALSGEDKDEKRIEAFERLAMNEEDASEKRQPLDYIFSVDILNEGIDIVEVNQVIMLRPTKSPIVFIQQLGRGLRKAEGKEYVVVLDFIGNYDNNFMIPIALSGDRTYNKDTIRRYMISGNNTIPGESTIYFDEIARERIFSAIDHIKGMKAIIGESYRALKNRIGREPLLLDFYENGEIDPLVIIKEDKTYWQFMEKVAKIDYSNKLSEQEKIVIEYLSRTVISGVRPNELFLLQLFLTKASITKKDFQEKLYKQYDYWIPDIEVEDTIKVLQGCFTSKDEEYQRYKVMEILQCDRDNIIRRLVNFSKSLLNEVFVSQVEDIINVGLRRYQDVYASEKIEGTPFVLYEKYTRRDICLLMNRGKDTSSTMYGMNRMENDVFIFITYHKAEAEDGKNYVEGKPDYADAFEDNSIFRWDSQIGKNSTSSYMEKVISAPRKHLFVKKSDAEINFYYMGQFDVIEAIDSQKLDNNGKLKPITKVKMRMHHPVRDDILRYLQSYILEKTKN